MIIPSEKYLQEVEIVPKPDEWQINTAGLDLRIGSKSLHITPIGDIERDISKYVELMPGAHFLVQTLEKISLPEGIMAVLYPRSGTNRKGITVDMTGIVDPGYSGHLMIPVTNLTYKPVRFLRGERIAQLVFHRVEEYTIKTRESKYKDSGMTAKQDKAEEQNQLESGELFDRKIKEL